MSRQMPCEQFHPQILLHEIISALVVYHMVDKHEQDHGLPAIPETIYFDLCPYYLSSGSNSSDNSDNSNASSSRMYIWMVSFSMKVGQNAVQTISTPTLCAHINN
ncbi:uncharacterized protein N7506_005051 [Penicillium brevicompactum]|uniref:uncharacterized protein n=1 Tax=Penicillium brevicompactum TaxID=5074 RepID=UPI0025416BA3|nr:uncharacterized protein N7506_005051 [Penicillium brevicompactum]KAJ5337029.1 hypothetical protein N7506_005051 [Penicillium brevicompactum]